MGQIAYVPTESQVTVSLQPIYSNQMEIQLNKFVSVIRLKTRLLNMGSPWARTKIRDGQYLDILKIRPVPEDSDDVIYEIQSQYHQRPDLLAYDMYGSSKIVVCTLNVIWIQRSCL